MQAQCLVEVVELIYITPTARPILPTVNCWSPVVSSCCSHHMELSPLGCIIIPVFIGLPLAFKNTSFFANPFLIYYYSTVFLYFYTLSCTLKSNITSQEKILIDIDIDNTSNTLSLNSYMI